MTNDELMKQFDKEFECDERSSICEVWNCRECPIYKDFFEDYKQSLGYMPTIQVGL